MWLATGTTGFNAPCIYVTTIGGCSLCAIKKGPQTDSYHYPTTKNYSQTKRELNNIVLYIAANEPCGGECSYGCAVISGKEECYCPIGFTLSEGTNCVGMLN